MYSDFYSLLFPVVLLIACSINIIQLSLVVFVVNLNACEQGQQWQLVSVQ